MMLLYQGRASIYMTSVGPWRSLVSASVWGAEGREFESRRPDQSENAHPSAGWAFSYPRKPAQEVC